MSENPSGEFSVQDFYESKIKEMGGTITPPKEYDLPQEYDLTNIPEDERPIVNFAIKKSVEFLGMPVVMDNLSESERLQIRSSSEDEILEKHGEQAKEEFKKMWGSNRMRSNNLNYLIPFKDFADSGWISNKNLVEKLFSEIKAIMPYEVDKYVEIDPNVKTLSPEARKEKIEEISDTLASLLQSMGKK